MAATCGGIRVYSVYVPNGRQPDSEHYRYKLAWLAALASLQAAGLRDVVRDRWPDQRIFTYWDYRAGMFHTDRGMRIDLVLASDPVADRVRAAWVDREARKGCQPLSFEYA